MITTGSTIYTGGQTMSLLAPGGDVAAKERLTLGGNPIKNDGTWREKWTDLPAQPAAGSLHVTVPQARSCWSG